MTTELDYNDITLKEGVEFKDILLHSPYEILMNCGLKEDVFWKYLLFSNEGNKDLANRIIRCLSFGEQSRSFMFLKGFSGCGKTTFVRWLIKSELFQTKEIEGNEIHGEYINLSFNTTHDSTIEKRKYQKKEEKEKPAVQEVYLNDIIAGKFKKQFRDYKSTFQLIADNFDDLESDFIGLGEKQELLHEIINVDYPSSQFNKKFNEFLKGLPSTTLLIICFLQKISYTKENAKKVCFFCIDNLDSLKYSYLIKEFWDDFLFSYNKTAQIVDKYFPNIDIKKRLKFLFVIREHHYYLINVNLNPHKYAVITSQLAKFSLTQPDLKGVLTKRVTLAEKKQLNINNRIMKIVDLIMEEDDIYREKFYLPLFNYDLRKLNQKIVDIILQDDLVQFEFNFETYKYLYKFGVFNTMLRTELREDSGVIS
jgi:GTPase SAR1 family protein